MTYNPAPTEPNEGRSFSENAGARVASFIRSFTTVLYVGMAMALVGLVLKFFALAAGNFLFVFAMAFLALLFLVQIGVSFFYVISNVRLALLGAISSAALVLGFLALVFRYQDWLGWQVMFFIALPLLLLTAVFLGMYLAQWRRLPKPHYNFLYRNLLFPYLFILVLGIVSLIMDADRFNQRDAGRLHESPLDNRTEETTTDTADMWRAY